jgi:hypothetical protein
MILFDLNCGQGHRFEGWFRDGAAFEHQAAAREIVCPVCGDTAVKKALMAPAVATRRGRAEPVPAAAEERPDRDTFTPQQPAEGRTAVHAQEADLPQLLRRMRRYIERNFDHVGPRFAEEARKIHQGEAEKRSIYGEATPEESRALREEGIEVAEIPWVPPHDA